MRLRCFSFVDVLDVMPPELTRFPQALEAPAVSTTGVPMAQRPVLSIIRLLSEKQWRLEKFAHESLAAANIP